MSNSCWSVLKLPRDSDERSIKRQYAALLKVTRPDEDPAGFQRLREAYEQAISFARRRAEHAQAQPREEEAEEPALQATAPVHAEIYADAPHAPLSVAPLMAAPEPVVDNHETLLQELFAQLNLDTLDDCLTIARQRGCQVAFEQRLLMLCLSNQPLAPAITEWAMATFDWLCPWQPTPLPMEPLQQLAVRQLRWKFAQLDQLLLDGQDTAALAYVDELLSRPWLESLDRREWLQRGFVSWLADSTAWSMEFFQALGKRLELLSDDYLQQDSPLWQALSHRYEGQKLLSRLRQHLAQKKPVFVADQATWLLLKDMGAGRRRRLIDRAEEEIWVVCAQLEALLDNHPYLLEKLGCAGLPNWRLWQPKPAGFSQRWWLLALAFVSVLIPEVSNLWETDLAYVYTPALLSNALCSAALGLLMWEGASMWWSWMAGVLAIPDGWLSNLLLPRAVARQGTGLLLLRHIVPCLTAGALAGLWVAQVLPYGWAYGALVAGMAVVYCLFRLGILRGWSPAKPLLRDKYIKWLNVCVVIALVWFVAVGDGGKRSNCVTAPVGDHAACLKRQETGLPAGLIGTYQAPATLPAQVQAKAPSANNATPAKPVAVKKPEKAAPAATAKKPEKAASAAPVKKPQPVQSYPVSQKKPESVYQLGKDLPLESPLLQEEQEPVAPRAKKKDELKYQQP